MRPSGPLLRHTLPLAILLAAVSVTSRANAGEYNKTYPMTGRASVRVRTDEGSVRVITSDASQVEFRVKYDVSPWRLGIGPDPHVDSNLKGNVAELNAHAGWRVGVAIGGEHMNIEVRMPKEADLDLETGDGHVEIASVNGHVVAHSIDGAIQVSQLTGTIDIRSTDGSIHARALKGNLKLQSTDGSITGAQLDGRCAVYTNDGSVQVTGRFDALDLRSDDGSVVARVESGSMISSPWSIRSSDGSVRVALPSDFKVNLDARTSGGHITMNLPAEARGRVSKSEFQGAMNGGGPSLIVRTNDGSIDFNRL